ncbi:MAG TPA: right-handed parallel beta-helix repeat-containing protein, partial [Candidatus Sumerlaeota bacterium]|nr:right-handed parallel beta-helix repeat-containing protein [Candidatus Sumerlaeota bacterium]
MQASTIIKVDGQNGDDTWDGYQWTYDGDDAGPKKTIRAGVLTAAFLGGGEVWIRQGTYLPSSTVNVGDNTLIAINMPSGVSIYGGFAGNESSRNERDQNPLLTIIDGSLANSGGPANHVIAIINAQDVIIDGLTITGALNPFPGGDEKKGGGILCDNSTLNINITNCFIRNNEFDAGIGAYNCANFPIITNSIIAANGNGVGIHLYYSNAKIQQCKIIGHSYAPQGGAVYMDHSHADIAGCIISGNDNGIHAEYSSPNITNTIIEGDDGIAVTSKGGNPNVKNCTIAGNRDGVYYESSGGIIGNTIIINNSNGVRRTGVENPAVSYCIFANFQGDVRDEDTGITYYGAGQINDLSWAENNYDLQDGELTFVNGPGGMIDAVGDLSGVFKILTDNEANFPPHSLSGKIVELGQSLYQK